jgi:uncharacterized membrane protein
MTRTLVIVLAVLSALGSGLVAGVFFAFSSFVMGALGRLAPGQGIAAMQSINIVVINPWFFAAFFGTAAGCLALAVFGVFNWSQPGMLYLLAGSALYLLGSILVTMAGNVPLNDALAAVQPDSADGAALWTRYLSTWTAWNHVRTLGSLAAAASFIVAALRMR